MAIEVVSFPVNILIFHHYVSDLVVPPELGKPALRILQKHPRNVGTIMSHLELEWDYSD